MAGTRSSTPTTDDTDGRDGTPPAVPRRDAGAYTVVARRYRPQTFEDVVGQDHVVRALRNAIRLDRIAQAYLFSGTRGVGKTSMARIFAKALNCERGGPTETPCDVCDTCRSIATGQDADVIEIDGASNNGVEAVRELRQNAGLRPIRSRFKIYYIDEVHMLSTSAFNALLKTLEEPPSHVKFVFATTEPNKIPITVLSRCQRFDFAGIGPEAIVGQLASICIQEGVEADPEGLHVVARRAAGSMRDAQSLLEQLLASGGERLTADRVHQLLGIAGDDRVLELLGALADRDPGEALTMLDRAVGDGVQPTDVLNSAIEFLRDVMVVAAGADVPPLAALPGQLDALRSLADRWSLDALLAAQQILAETRGRLRGSPHTRLLVELALCRVARLEDLEELATLVATLSAIESGAPAPGPAAAVKKKSPEPLTTPHPSAPGPIASAPVECESAALTAFAAPDPPNGATPGPSTDPGPGTDAPALDRVRYAWKELAEAAEDLKLPASFRKLEPTAMDGDAVVVVAVPSEYNFAADRLEAPELRSRIEGSLSEAIGRPLSVRFRREAASAEGTKQASAGSVSHQAVLQDELAQALVARFEATLRRVELGPEEPVEAASEADPEG